MREEFGKAHFGKPFCEMSKIELCEAESKVLVRLQDNSKHWDKFFLQEELNSIRYHLKFLISPCMKETIGIYREGTVSEIRRDCEKLCASARLRQITLENRIKCEGLDLVTDQTRCTKYPNPQCLITIKAQSYAPLS